MEKKSSIERKSLLGLYKRFFIVFICCVPFMLLFGITLAGNINNILQILIYCVFFSFVFIIEEYIYKAKKEQRERLKKEYLENLKKEGKE